MEKKVIYVLVGASGSGKTTLTRQYISAILGIPEMVSMTSRPMREGEVEGQDYYFVPRSEFEYPNRAQFVEMAEYDHNYYGLTHAEIKNKLTNHDEICIVTERKGAAAIKEIYQSDLYEVAVIYMYSSPVTILKRMLSFRKESHKKVLTRFRHAMDNNEFCPPECADYVIVSEGISSLSGDSAQFCNIRKEVLSKR